MSIKYTEIDTYVPEFWDGNENLVVRLWTYLHRGLDFVNQARYWIIGILGLYAVLKLTNPVWIAAMVVVSSPILIFVGRWHLYRVSKTQEFITSTKGTVLGYSSYNVQVRQMKLLEEIANNIRNVR